MAAPLLIRWSEQDYLQGAEVLLYARNTHKKPMIQLSAGDAFRAVMTGLWEAEQAVIAALYKATGFDPKEVMKNLPVESVGGRRETAKHPEVVKAFGNVPLLSYSGAQRVARDVVRASRFTRALPVLGGGPPPQVVDRDEGNVHALAPLVVIVIGLVGVAALSAAAYSIKEYFHANAEVETEKLRVNAEMALKQQALQAQIAAGQKPDLSALVLSKGNAEETSRWAVPLGFAAAGLAGGAVLWRASKR